MPSPSAFRQGSYAHEASLAFEYPDEPRACVIERSIRREVDEIDDDRSRARVDREGRVLRVSVEAADLVGLRAGLNTWLGLVDVAERAAEAAEGYTPPASRPG